MADLQNKNQGKELVIPFLKGFLKSISIGRKKKIPRFLMRLFFLLLVSLVSCQGDCSYWVNNFTGACYSGFGAESCYSIESQFQLAQQACMNSPLVMNLQRAIQACMMVCRTVITPYQGMGGYGPYGGIGSFGGMGYPGANPYNGGFFGNYGFNGFWSSGEQLKRNMFYTFVLALFAYLLLNH